MVLKKCIHLHVWLVSSNIYIRCRCFNWRLYLRVCGCLFLGRWKHIHRDLVLAAASYRPDSYRVRAMFHFSNGNRLRREWHGDGVAAIPRRRLPNQLEFEANVEGVKIVTLLVFANSQYNGMVAGTGAIRGLSFAFAMLEIIILCVSTFCVCVSERIKREFNR